MVPNVFEPLKFYCTLSHLLLDAAQCAYSLQIEDLTLTQLRIQLNSSYGRKGEEAVTEGWDYMQKIVSFWLRTLKACKCPDHPDNHKRTHSEKCDPFCQ